MCLPDDAPVAGSQNSDISSFPGINFDCPRTAWQKENKEHFAAMAWAYELILMYLTRNGIVQNDHLVLKSSNYQCIALANILAAAMRRLKRITCVAWDGDGEASLILTRSLFDCVVSALLIKKDPGNAELYLKFGAIENKKILDRLEKHLPSPEKNKKERDEARKLYDELAPLFTEKDKRVRNHWHPLWKLSERSALVGLSNHYDIGFTRYSDLSHGGFSALMQHASYGTDEWRFSLASKEKDVFEAIHESTKYLMVVFAAFAHTQKVSELSKDLVSGYEAIASNADYQDCLTKNPWLKEWIAGLKETKA